MLLLARLLHLAPSAPEPASLDDFAAHHRALAADLPLPFDRGVLTAAVARHVGFAFASGYRSALEALIGDLPAEGPVSLAVTERGGAHPRAIEATLKPDGRGGYRLTGHKRWSTMATGQSGLLLVAASQGLDEAGKKRLRVARIRSTSPGVTITPMPETPFVPEIPHGEITFDEVAVAEVDLLPGDGYERYIKPFRTIEDIHVFGAFLGYTLGAARRHDWPRSLCESTLAVIASLRALATADPSSPAVHVALAGAIRFGGSLIEETAPLWAGAGAEARREWERDRALLGVAAKAREKRLESAYRALGSG